MHREFTRRTSTMAGARFLRLSIALASVTSGCIPPPPPAEPAAQRATTPSPGAGSATLEGPIARIDGREPPNTGKPIPISTGCHVVRTRDHAGLGSADVMVQVRIIAANIPIHVQPGHRYVVVLELGEQSGYTGHGRVYARELDAHGRETRIFAPARDEAELAACRGAR
jgi:hypothetical protein